MTEVRRSKHSAIRALRADGQAPPLQVALIARLALASLVLALRPQGEEVPTAKTRRRSGPSGNSALPEPSATRWTRLAPDIPQPVRPARQQQDVGPSRPPPPAFQAPPRPTPLSAPRVCGPTLGCLPRVVPADSPLPAGASSAGYLRACSPRPPRFPARVALGMLPISPSRPAAHGSRAGAAPPRSAQRRGRGGAMGPAGRRRVTPARSTPRSAPERSWWLFKPAFPPPPPRFGRAGSLPPRSGRVLVATHLCARLRFPR